MNRSTASASPPRAARAQAVTVSSSRTTAPGGEGRTRAGDDGGVHCSEFRTAISARVDGEELPPGISPAALDAHLGSCAECREWGARARRLKGLAVGLGLM
ncbi:zf-HC2 domain-containing protein [Streptomyces sp. NPDC046261]|uniref:zf-HC2 domain-containing protein n=1 Tax=Streptomyces sp. NPDC046261 TaxID=3157200 RepID=UPI0033E9656D